MNYTVGAVIHGFEITEVRDVIELESRCVRMRHVKSGADLVWMDNGAENKLFSIAFKTIPEDSTGVFHILEHSVLCGSEKYPVKEPFVELLKSSLNTFLNAMTFPDKTMYPVSSRNEKDFINLSRVYLDAVFKPAILSNPNIFYQEGWHYQLSEDGEPGYIGVVFNEMKGAYSSVDRVLRQELFTQLFPDNCYGLSSGGDPVHIPELTYEKFIETYRRFYHPSNSYIYLDGALPIENMLKIIDEEYLCGYECSMQPVVLELQQPVETHEAVCRYEIGSDEDPTDRTQMMMGKIICDWSDCERQLAAYVLGDYLTGSNDSPLKKAILEAGLGQDVNLTVDDGIAQAVMLLHIRNTSAQKRDGINKAISETAKTLLEKGIDRGGLEAALNRVEFQLRQGQEPKGLERAINALSSWLYGGDPLLYLTRDEVFASLRAKLNGDYFERLLEEFLVERSNTVTVWCEPSAELGEERVKAERERLNAAASEWSESDRESILSLNRSLEQWQQTPDTKEDINKLPALVLSDVDEAPSERITEVNTQDNIRILTHPADAKGITYFSLYFNVSDFEPSEMSALSLLANLMGELPTSERSASMLNQEIKTHIGELDFGVKNYGIMGNTEECRSFFCVNCSVLDDKLERAADLIAEVLCCTRFDVSDDIKKIITQICDSRRRGVIAEGHRYGMYRTLAPYSADACLNENANGFSYYEYVRGLNDSENGAEKFADFASKAVKKLFCRSRLTVSITSGADSDVSLLYARLPEGDKPVSETTHPELPAQRKESIRVPAAVSFAALGVNAASVGAEYCAELQLLAHIASYHYLWNVIRVQGGAYGAGMQASESGNLFFYSFRDPNSGRSLGAFRGTTEFIREFCRSDEPLDKSIIGCISHLDPLCSTGERSMLANGDYFRGVTHELRCRRWKELLEADKEKLGRLCDVLDTMLEKASVCVIGGSDILAGCVGEELVPVAY